MWSGRLSGVSNDKLKKMATTAGLTLAVGLMIIKFVASFFTGSLAILSSLVDSISDIAASVIAFVAVRFSSLPASYQHRYGFGKAEALSALVQSAFIAGSGFFVIYEGINRFINPQPLADMMFGIIVMIISLFFTIAVVAFQRYVARRTKSMAVDADSVHYAVDIVTNVSIIISLFVVKFLELNWFDPLAAVFVSGYLLYNAFRIAKDAVGLLMDKELPEDVRENVLKAINMHNFCRGVHDLRTRNLGSIYLFELHLELDGNLSLNDAHRLTEIIEGDIKRLYPKAQVIIHQDPAGLDEERLDNMLIG